MKTKFIGFIGILIFSAAVIAAQFISFPAATVIEIALAAFGLTAVIVSAVKSAKERGRPSWKTAVVIALAVIGGVLCCLGGLTQNIFETVSGMLLAILTVILGILFE